MALEEELMQADKEVSKEEEPTVEKSPDDPTDEEIEAIKEVMAMP
jgi:hypothetical protein